MKVRILKIFLLAGLLLSSYQGFTQAGDYSFSFSTSAYTPLGVSATRLTGVEGDFASADAPIGFDFEFEGLNYDTVSVASDGFISFIAGASAATTNDLDNGSTVRRPLAAPLWDDLDGRASSSGAYYETSGTAPNRVFTFEWRDWEWRWNSTDSVVSFQVKLYETTNVIEFHYDYINPSGVNTPSASIGLSGATTFLSVFDTSATPTVSNTAEYATVDTVVSNRVFTFTPPSCVAPAQGTFSFVGLDSLQFNFISGTPAGPFEVEYGPVGFTQGTNAANLFSVLDTFANVGGLPSSTTLEFYVRLDCGGGSFSSWAGPFSISTLCDVFAAPYIENFDGASWVSGSGSTNAGDAINSCWSRSDESGHFWGTRSGTTTSGSTGPADDFNGGGNYVFTETSSGSTGDTTTLTSPSIDISALSTPFLSFEYHMYGASMGTLSVDINDGNGWQTNQFSVSGQVQTSGSDAWMKGSVDLSAMTLASDTIQIRFTGVRGTSFNSDMSIDEVRVGEAPSCTEPIAISASFVGADSVVVSWDSVNTTYVVEYGLSGFALGSGSTVTVTDTFAGIGSLTDNTLYDFYVTSDCSATGNGLSAPTGPVSITTLCTFLTAPSTETFNGGVLPSCWTEATTQSSGWLFTGGAGWGATGNGGKAPGTFAWVDGSGTGSNDNRLVSPFYDVSGLSDPQLYFEFFSNNTNTPTSNNTLQINLWDGAQWNDSVFVYQGNDPAWQLGEVLLTGFTITGPIQFEFIVNETGGTTFHNDILLDSVVVDEAPPCPNPGQLTATNILPFQADLGWTNPNGTAWNIEIVPTGFGQGSGTVTPITNNPYTPNNLMPNTCYDYYVQQDCGVDGTSLWIGPFTFCTPPTCPAPTNLGVDPGNLTINSADIYFTPGLASNYNVQFDTVGFALGFGSRLQVTNDTVSLTNLMPGTELSSTYETAVAQLIPVLGQAHLALLQLSLPII